MILLNDQKWKGFARFPTQTCLLQPISALRARALIDLPVFAAVYGCSTPARWIDMRKGKDAATLRRATQAIPYPIYQHWMRAHRLRLRGQISELRSPVGPIHVQQIRQKKRLFLFCDVLVSVPIKRGSTVSHPLYHRINYVVVLAKISLQPVFRIGGNCIKRQTRRLFARIKNPIGNVFAIVLIGSFLQLANGLLARGEFNVICDKLFYRKTGH